MVLLKGKKMKKTYFLYLPMPLGGKGIHKIYEISYIKVGTELSRKLVHTTTDHKLSTKKYFELLNQVAQ